MNREVLIYTFLNREHVCIEAMLSADCAIMVRLGSVTRVLTGRARVGAQSL